MTLIWRAVNVLLRIARDLGGVLVTLLIAVLAYVVMTQTGTRLLLREVSRAVPAVQIEGVSGRLWGPLRVEHLRYADASVRVAVDDAELDWSLLQLLALNVSISRLQAGQVQVSVLPAPTPAAPAAADAPMPTRLPVGLLLKRLKIDRFELQQPQSEALVIEHIGFSGGWQGNRVQVLELAAQTPWVGAVAMQAEARLYPDRLEIARLTTQGFVQASLGGTLGYSHTASDLDLQWQTLRWPPAARAGMADEPLLLSSPKGQLHWQGTFDDWRYTVQTRLAVMDEVLAVQGQGHGSLSQVVAERLVVDSGHGKVTLGAEVQLDAPLRATVKGQIQALDPAHWLAALNGRIQGGFEVEVIVRDDQPEVTFDLHLDQSELQGLAADLRARGRLLGERLTLSTLALRSGDNRLEASGQVLPRLDVRSRIRARDLSQLLPQLGGRINADVRASGALQQPRVAGQIDLRKFRFDDIRGAALKAVFDLDLDQLLALDVSLRDWQLGTELADAGLHLHGRVGQHLLTLDATTPQAQVQLTLEGALDLARQHWRGAVNALNLHPADLPPLALQAPAPLSVAADGTLSLESLCLAGPLAQLCASLTPQPRSARLLTLDIERADLAQLAPLLPPELSVKGGFAAQARVLLGQQGIEDLHLNLDNDLLTLQRGEFAPLHIKPGFIHIEDQGEGLMADASLPFDQGGVQLNAVLGGQGDLTRRALQGELRIELPDLSWLSTFHREIQAVEGRLDGGFQLGGTLGAPQISGDLALAQARLRLRTPGLEIERLRAVIRGASDDGLSVFMEAYSDNGPLRINGDVDLQTLPPKVDLLIRGDHFQALRTGEAKAWISPQLEVALANNRLNVTGVVDVPRAEITPKNIDGGVGPSADQIIIRRGDAQNDDPPLGIFAQVTLRLGDAVSIDGFGLKTKVSGSVSVSESPGVATRAKGELELVEGHYKAYGQDLTVETGKLLFTGGPLTDPAVELKATRQPREDINVGVLVRGTLDKPEFSLFSTPAMPQENQLAWLVLGRSLEANSNASDRGIVADAALGMGLAGGDWLAQRLGHSIGLDEISLGAKPGESADQAQLTVGKYLSPKLFISYGVGLFQPGHTFRLQYDIGHGFKLATETGVESGGDLLYTVEH
ncbi:translocation/assembly module TamB domain-containing protein [Sinimarinibacterium sp. NLF-5-8]|uniref:translocation/assembly module TamB domain-containing protein n=1 Tax=Sinimarinibacterium sp. NLF-5-8 TaxID=2698684 RepID=UPI00137B9FFD|nr:translocation/assembly module TamB domain-containing protein [Sinimarinibacterium sp. NLF-5-8]QHS10568.1 hypothetical protein GT972_10795 [Sinimarinibacterium sp. NLF-5-8]